MIDLSNYSFTHDVFRKTGRTSIQELIANPLIISNYLVMPFIKTISQGFINPFKQLN
jgi:hypothetical protein